MVVRKAEMETPGSGVPEARSKSAVVDIDSKLKAISSDPPYEAIIQQIAYLMSAITNQNPKNNGQNGSKHNNGNGKTTNKKTQGQKKNQKDMHC